MVHGAGTAWLTYSEVLDDRSELVAPIDLATGQTLATGVPVSTGDGDDLFGDLRCLDAEPGALAGTRWRVPSTL